MACGALVPVFPYLNPTIFARLRIHTTVLCSLVIFCSIQITPTHKHTNHVQPNYVLYWYWFWVNKPNPDVCSACIEKPFEPQTMEELIDGLRDKQLNPTRVKPHLAFLFNLFDSLTFFHTCSNSVN